MLTRRTLIAILVFVVLLFLANLYFFRTGYWFYQDAGYWPKNSYEAMKMFVAQFHSFTNDGYYLGVDQGLFSFTRIAVIFYSTVLFFLFGQGGSQIALVLSSYLLAFVSFYLFSGLFFQDKRVRYILSLLYVFNPFSYTLQGHVYFNAIAPLFLYSFYKFFYGSVKIRMSWLILNILSGFLWVSYIRFLQSNFIIIIPFILYFFFQERRKFPVRKVVLFFGVYLLLFLPIIYSFATQLLEKSQTAFNYGSVFGKFVITYPMYNAFNLFQTVAVRFYEGTFWSVVGTIFFAVIIYLLITFPRKQYTAFFYLNLSLVVAGITFYALGNVFGKSAYLFLVKIFPFVTNEPYWGFYVLVMPIMLLLGIIIKDRITFLYRYAIVFIALALLPLLRLGDFQLQKYDLKTVPSAYQSYFIQPTGQIPEASFYFPNACWRAEFMNAANTPTLCVNYGYRFSSIFTDNPRIVSGAAYALSQQVDGTVPLDNFRITHNLKHVFIPNDIVKKKGPGPETNEKILTLVQQAKALYNVNPSLRGEQNQNFNHYAFTNKDSYDFFLYSPREVFHESNESFYLQPKAITDAPVVVGNGFTEQLKSATQGAQIEYKIAHNAPGKYYVKVSAIDTIRPYLLQLNQTYGSSWKIKPLTKTEFDEVTCLNSERYEITKNLRCQYDRLSFDPQDIRYLFRPDIADAAHFPGNFLGNGWLLEPTEESSYLLLIYTKQVYFTYFIIISLTTLAILLLMSIIQEVMLRMRNSSDTL